MTRLKYIYCGASPGCTRAEWRGRAHTQPKVNQFRITALLVCFRSLQGSMEGGKKAQNKGGEKGSSNSGSSRTGRGSLHGASFSQGRWPWGPTEGLVPFTRGGPHIFPRWGSSSGGSGYFVGPWGREEPSHWGTSRETSRCAPVEVVPLPVGAGGILPCFPVAACLRPHLDWLIPAR